jgi:hypothetical protein
VAVAATAIGVARGRLAIGRPVGISSRQVGVALGILVLGLAWPAPRQAPPDPITVATRPAGPGLVDLTVSGPGTAGFAGAERLEVFAWQGGTDPVNTGGAGRVNIPLTAQPDGTWVAARPVPVGGSWKSMVMVNNGADFGALGVYLPHDEEYGLAEVPVLPERTGQLQPAQAVLMREAHGDAGPWVAVLAYIVLALGLGAETAVLLAGGAAQAGRSTPSASAASTSNAPMPRLRAARAS